MQEHIPVMRPRLPSPARIIGRLSEIHDSGYYSNFGGQVRELESRLAEFVGVHPDRVVSVANATLGIAGAVAVSGATEWFAPSWTFTASAAAIIMGGGAPTFADIEADSHWLDVSDRGASHGVLIVAPFGLAIRPELLARTTPTIIDAAASLGMAQGALGQMSENVTVVYSLHATKVMGIGEGGFVVFGSESRAQEFRAWTNFGFFHTRESRSIGSNAKMSELHAAVGHAVLDYWDEERSEWLAARQMVRELSRTLELNSLDPTPDLVSPYWIVHFSSESERESVERGLSAAGIATRRWWLDGCHRMPAYRDVPQEPLGNTERVAAVTLGLPFFRGLTECDPDRFIEAIGAVRV